MVVCGASPSTVTSSSLAMAMMRLYPVFWNVDTHEHLATLEGIVGVCCVHPFSNKLFSGAAHRNIVWNVEEDESQEWLCKNYS